MLSQINSGPYDEISDALHSCCNPVLIGCKPPPHAYSFSCHSLFSLAAAPAFANSSSSPRVSPRWPPLPRRVGPLALPTRAGPGSLNRHDLDTARAGGRDDRLFAAGRDGVRVVRPLGGDRACAPRRTGRSWQGSVRGRARSAVAFTEQFSHRPSEHYRRLGRANAPERLPEFPALDARRATFSFFTETRFFTSLPRTAVLPTPDLPAIHGAQ